MVQYATKNNSPHREVIERSLSNKLMSVRVSPAVTYYMVHVRTLKILPVLHLWTSCRSRYLPVHGLGFSFYLQGFPLFCFRWYWWFQGGGGGVIKCTCSCCSREISYLIHIWVSFVINSFGIFRVLNGRNVVKVCYLAGNFNLC